MLLKKCELRVRHHMTTDPLGTTLKAIESCNYPSACKTVGLHVPIGFVGTKLQIPMLYIYIYIMVWFLSKRYLSKPNNNGKLLDTLRYTWHLLHINKNKSFHMKYVISFRTPCNKVNFYIMWLDFIGMEDHITVFWEYLIPS